MRQPVGAGLVLGVACLALAAGTAIARPSARSSAASSSQRGIAAGPISGKQRIRTHQSYSTNWSGYAAVGDTFTNVTGTWTEPTASCSGVKGHKVTYATFFAGLDGYMSPTVEQTGVDAICLGSTAYYHPWYEFYPAASVTIPCVVQAGDTLTSDVSVSGGTVTTSLADATRSCDGTAGGSWTSGGQTSSTGLELDSAEWITEAVAHTLTNFTSVHFSSASATDTAGTTDGIDNGPWGYDEIILVSHNGRVMRAEPQNLSTSGTASAFDDVWMNP